MKKLIVILAAVIFSLGSFAQSAAMANPGPKAIKKYCAMEKEGKIVVMVDKKEITKDVTLENGTVIKPNGTITKKDGTTSELKKGECINPEGKISKEEKEMKPEEKTKPDDKNDKKKSY